MYNLKEANKSRVYEFSWKVVGYDGILREIRSQTFRVNFQVTDWYMKLDLSKLQNIDSRIPFLLQRLPNIGPNAVTLNVKITVKLSSNKYFKLEKSHTAKVFSEKGENFWAFDIDIPYQKLESKDANFKWLTSKDMVINVEMESSTMNDPCSSQNFWYEDSHLMGVTKSLEALYSEGYFHDIVLKVAGKELKLHKCILNARWPKLLSSLKTGKSLDEVETVEFSGIPYGLLVDLLKFAYCGDLDFMSKPGVDLNVFSLVNEHNFYRLNDQITQLAPSCRSSQIFKSYRTSFEMKFTNVTSTRKEKEKFLRLFGFMDIRMYVNKGPFGYNWLMFSVVLGKIPQKNEVTIQCKLYVVGEGTVKYLLTEQNLVFDAKTEVSFTTPFSKNETCKRYKQVSEPVITWRELTDEQNNFMQNRLVESVARRAGKSYDKPVQKIEKDLVFIFELKLADGEFLYQTSHGVFEFGYEGDYKIFKDLELMYNDEFTDIQVTSGERAVNAHKAILAARSTSFKDYLTKMPHSKSLSIDIKPEYLHIFIHYLYTGQIQLVPGVGKDDILHKAKFYGINPFGTSSALKRASEEDFGSGSALKRRE